MGLVHSSPSDADSLKADNVERPRSGEHIHKLSSPKHNVQDPASDCSYGKSKANFCLPVTHALKHEQKISSLGSQLAQGLRLVLDIDTSTDLVVERFKHSLVTSRFIEQHRCVLEERLSHESRLPSSDAGFQGSFSEDKIKQESRLTLEVTAGPSQGLSHSVQSTSTSNLPLTLGRVPPGDVLLKDSEVSGKHAMINWNSNKLKWELIDMGSLNGTLVNSKAINNPDTSSRNHGCPVGLTSGDLITLGTTSQIHVQIMSHDGSNIPFGVGIASDPMAVRRGGKKLPMEDVCYFHWPIPGVHQFGVFGICDGHGGADAAKSASKLLPEMVAKILSDSSRREMVLSKQDASDVLKDAFSLAEANLNHYYEGCTATLLLIWISSAKTKFIQCANVGDSACVVNVDGKQIKMTEDHRITSYSERLRMKETGQPLKDGEKRLCGLNLGRMLGDKFLKEQDSRFSSQPHISPVIQVHQTKEAFALLASDGFWDVVSIKKAVQLVLEVRERYAGSDEMEIAKKVAAFLVNEAREMRTKDNTSIVYLDFDSSLRTACEYDDS